MQKKEWESLRSKGTPIECSFCRDWHCMNCADMRKSELPLVVRDDMFWACTTCKPQIPTLFAQAQRQSNLTTPNENIHETLTESLNAIENRLEAKLDAKLKATVKAIQESIQPIQQKVSETVENSVSVNMSKTWSETLFGEQSESFPATGDPRHKDALIKPKLTLKKAIKEVAIKQTKRRPEQRKQTKNVIIYRAPELHDPSAKYRAEHDTKLINELLETIDIDAKPIKFIRLGK